MFRTARTAGTTARDHTGQWKQGDYTPKCSFSNAWLCADFKSELWKVAASFATRHEPQPLRAVRVCREMCVCAAFGRCYSPDLSSIICFKTRCFRVRATLVCVLRAYSSTIHKGPVLFTCHSCFTYAVSYLPCSCNEQRERIRSSRISEWIMNVARIQGAVGVTCVGGQWPIHGRAACERIAFAR